MAATLGATETQNVADLLGGKTVLRRNLTSPLEAHEAVAVGLPSGAIVHLTKSLGSVVANTAFDAAIGMSVRTLQRRKAAAEKPLTADQGGKAWRFAEILLQATRVFGSQAEAEAWMQKPATALDRKTPLELMATVPGAEMVETLLERLEYGVYT